MRPQCANKTPMTAQIRKKGREGHGATCNVHGFPLIGSGPLLAPVTQIPHPGTSQSPLSYSTNSSGEKRQSRARPRRDTRPHRPAASLPSLPSSFVLDPWSLLRLSRGYATRAAFPYPHTEVTGLEYSVGLRCDGEKVPLALAR
ncbi:hypothetical protein V496_06745 [Pseudogymnoascus sp. VKM F-4515 (FW-2607)]|nr:hypothetical protein V496_06745 [Pseudogymnoascus sp. VKM F-4515 (FW-2607)]KFY88655.1 hypothetical protein V498_06703 [Pseudogymnoascus sp. VKM F-4517 (FW-2822)]